MILQFLRERRSWILFFLFLQGMILFIAYLDSSLPIASMIYLVFLSVIGFIVFLVIRYVKETKYYRSLHECEHSLDIAGLAKPESPFEHLFHEMILSQTEHLKHTVTQNHQLLEQEKDELLGWIHEVKTPLSAMHLMIERISDPQLKASLQYEWLRIHHLLDQQLHQKRIQFIERDLHINSIDLQTILHQEIRALQAICMQKGIGFDLELQVRSELSDAKWLCYILRQLLTNALKYSETSEIRTGVSRRRDGRSLR